jgi:alpha-galactosidase
VDWIEGGGVAIGFVSVGGAVPVLAYWGPSLEPAPKPADLVGFAEVAVPHGGLDAGEVFDLLPQAGLGFFGHPGVRLARDGREIITQLVLAQVEAAPGRIGFALSDTLAGVEVWLSFEIDDRTGVASASARVKNRGADTLEVIWLASALPLVHDEVMMFSGRWAREFRPSRTRLAAGQIVQDDLTGRTSHHAPPFWAVGEPGFGEQSGQVIGLHLGWSGDHRGIFERLGDGRVQFQAGELLARGEVVLSAGDSYSSPTLYAACSDRGLNGLSDRFHPFVRDVVLGGRLRNRPRPVHLNTWEAVYFDHDLAALKALADAAHQVGVERFVLDDGWFKGRADDTAGLGDWTADPVKYPTGLGPLVEHVRGLGLEFGLWVEPEMVNLDSDLARAHPDWILGAPDRAQPLGRGQHVLNLSHPKAFEAILLSLDGLLSAHPIDYLKWDMNRALTHAVSEGVPMVHCQVIAVYALIDRLRARHPDVEIESCASGGGRIDFGILQRTDRVWASDCNDPFDRQAIQRALSIFLPPELIGAHVGPARAHTTGRWASMGFRAQTALFGAMGVEADVRTLDARERAKLAAAISLYKQHRGLIHSGRQSRLEHPDPGCLCFMIASAREALVSVAQVETPVSAVPASLCLRGLGAGAWVARRVDDPGPGRHRMKIAPAAARGEHLQGPAGLFERAGIPLPVMQAGESALFHLVRTD